MSVSCTISELLQCICQIIELSLLTGRCLYFTPSFRVDLETVDCEMLSHLTRNITYCVVHNIF